MAYDPNLPANNSLANSAELRSQLTGLKALIDTKPDAAAVSTQISNESAGPCLGVNALLLTASNPPTQAQVQAVIDRLNQLITALKRP